MVRFTHKEAPTRAEWQELFVTHKAFKVGDFIEGHLLKEQHPDLEENDLDHIFVVEGLKVESKIDKVYEIRSLKYPSILLCISSTWMFPLGTFIDTSEPEVINKCKNIW